MNLNELIIRPESKKEFQEIAVLVMESFAKGQSTQSDFLK